MSDLSGERRRGLHDELATALAAGGTDVAERVAGHLRRADRPEAALAVLEQGAEAAETRGDLGRCATLYLAAFRLASEHAALGARRGALQRRAVEHLYRARRWTELDPLIRDAWSRRDRLSVDERAALAQPLAWQLFARGRVAESWSVTQQELAHAQDTDAGDAAPPALPGRSLPEGGDMRQTQHSQHHEPHHHDRSEQATDPVGTEPLAREQHRENGNADR